MNEPCAHRWRIQEQTPGTPMLPGTCRHCGATKTFAASESASFGDFAVSAQRGAETARKRKRAQKVTTA